MSEVCWTIGDPTVALATLAQVCATLAALGGGFGVMMLQAMAERQRALTDRFFELLQELGTVTGQPYTPETLKSAKSYLDLAIFEGNGDRLADRALDMPPGTTDGQDPNRAIHATVAWRRVKIQREELVRERNWVLALTALPVVLNGMVCAMALTFLLVTTFCGMLTVRSPELVGRWLAAGTVSVLLVTVACAVWLLARSAKHARGGDAT